MLQSNNLEHLVQTFFFISVENISFICYSKSYFPHYPEMNINLKVLNFIVKLISEVTESILGIKYLAIGLNRSLIHFISSQRHLQLDILLDIKTVKNRPMYAQINQPVSLHINAHPTLSFGGGVFAPTPMFSYLGFCYDIFSFLQRGGQY